MTDCLIPDRGEPATSVILVDTVSFPDWSAAQPQQMRAVLIAQKFIGAADSVAIVPQGDDWQAVVGVRSTSSLGPWCLARAAEMLPAGAYRVGLPIGAAGLGWLLGHYRFDRYRAPESVGPRVMLTQEPAPIAATLRIARAVALVRDMVNTPAADMGPAALEAEVARVAAAYDAALTVTRGGELERDYPMIHAVGRAAGRGYEPRLIELEWGNPAHPRVAIVGKGVCFDSGGLDIKPSAGMRLMKKDMGGAAHALALAELVMGARLPVRLHLLIPAVENAIAGNAFRPGDVLTARGGTTVEIGNTDAEGRLVLADALTRAVEANPNLLIDFATLTGAARVALGPDLPATFANDDALADAAIASGRAVDDPLWRLPLHDGYDDMLKSDIADLTNAPEGGLAGAITAALFLRRFVPGHVSWLHLDTFAWRPQARPGRPKGGEALGLRAMWHLLATRFG